MSSLTGTFIVHFCRDALDDKEVGISPKLSRWHAVTFKIQQFRTGGSLELESGSVQCIHSKRDSHCAESPTQVPRAYP